MKPILEIQNISKKFRIQHETQPYLSIRDSLGSIFQKNKSSKEDFYALKDVSFNVMPGESIGIIGKNGAGKSTLLKILSKITPPSSGKIISRGRIASLLEVGTGFHSELSGRENVFLNGSILGMKRKEIQKNFDAIVEFAGVEKFIDTPLKHYSSGMQLRLAFAVAAFLENEILVIDEVLAVGDTEFQKKCIDKMDEVSKSGRTVLFVSHNMSALQALCKYAIFLKNGQLFLSGKAKEVIKEYLEMNLSQKQFEMKRSTAQQIYIEKISIKNENNNSQSIILEINISSKISKSIAIDFRIYTTNGEPVCFGSLGTFSQNKMQLLHVGINNLKVEIKSDSLANGLYYMSVDLTLPDKEFYDRAEQVLFFEVLNLPKESSGRVLLQDWNYGNFIIPVETI